MKFAEIRSFYGFYLILINTRVNFLLNNKLLSKRALFVGFTQSAGKAVIGQPLNLVPSIAYFTSCGLRPFSRPIFRFPSSVSEGRTR